MQGPWAGCGGGGGRRCWWQGSWSKSTPGLKAGLFFFLLRFLGRGKRENTFGDEMLLLSPVRCVRRDRLRVRTHTQTHASHHFAQNATRDGTGKNMSSTERESRRNPKNHNDVRMTGGQGTTENRGGGGNNKMQHKKWSRIRTYVRTDEIISYEQRSHRVKNWSRAKIGAAQKLEPRKHWSRANIGAAQTLEPRKKWSRAKNAAAQKLEPRK
jgi:hypothetical protein